MDTEKIYRVSLVVCVVIILILVTFMITLVYPFWERKAPLKVNFAMSEVEEMEFSHPVERGAVLGAHWFGRVQRVDGSFVYTYDPDNATEITKYPYSIARHCGSIYTLVWAYQHTGDERYLDSAEHAAEYISDMIREDGDRRYILNGGRSKLFDNALALIGFCYLYNATGKEEHLGNLKGFANLCLDLLDDKGRFDYIYDPLLPDEFSENLMASGEGLLGLALAYEFTGFEKYLEGFELSAEYHMEILTSENLKNMSTAYYSWMSSAFSKGYMLTGDRSYLDASYAISEWLVTRYFGAYFRVQGVPASQAMAEEPELLGSFRTFPSMNSCTYSEGLADVLHAAIEANDTYYINRYKDILLNASRFILNLMYDEDEAYNLTQPHLTLGGYRHDLFDRVNEDMQWQSRWIRIDYTQHAIGALFRIMRDIPAEEIQDYYGNLNK